MELNVILHDLLVNAYFAYINIIAFFLTLVPSHIQARLTYLKAVLIQQRTLIFGRYLLELHPEAQDLTGKTAIVTGANSGIGLQIAQSLAQQNATVYIACRNESKFQPTIDHITVRAPSSKGRVHAMKLDTGRLESIKAFAMEWSKRQDKRLDILVHNAGISHNPLGEDLTEEGIPTIYATNFLGSFALTYYLEPYLADDARVILTSSTAQLTGRFSSDFATGPVRGISESGFHSPPGSTIPLLNWKVGSEPYDNAKYANTKLMQCAFAKMLQRRFDAIGGSSVSASSSTSSLSSAGKPVRTNRRVAHSFTPGYTMTPIFGKIEEPSFFKDPVYKILVLAQKFATDVDQGAATGVWLATTKDSTVVGPGGGGGYWDRMQPMMSAADLLPKALLDRMWLRWQRDAGVEWKSY